MYRLIKDEVYETLNAGNHMNVCKALKELDKIELARRGKGVYTLDCSLSKNKKGILKAFNMGEGDVTMAATKLQEILSKL